MQNLENHHDDGIPRFEPWLGVMAVALLPAILTVLLPGQYLIPLVTVAAALFTASLLMLRRQTQRRRLHRETMGGGRS